MIKVGLLINGERVGLELLRLLVMHPNVRIQAVASSRFAGLHVEELFVLFRHHFHAEFVEPAAQCFLKCDLVFIASSLGVSSALVAELLERKIKVVHLPPCFPASDNENCQTIQGASSFIPSQPLEAATGFPEVQRLRLRQSKYVCLPTPKATLLLLALLPLLEKGALDHAKVVAHFTSGAAEAIDRQMKDFRNLECNIRTTFVSESIVPELAQAYVPAFPVFDLETTAVNVPALRGMHLTIVAHLSKFNASDVLAFFEERYADEPFVDVLASTSLLDAGSVKGTNMCRLAIDARPIHNNVVIVALMDDLIKGAAGQALQVMNIMHGIPESIGLKNLAIIQ